MIKNTFALLAVVALAACSSGSDSPTPDTGTPTTPTTPIPGGGGNPPATGTTAGTYTGDFGTGNGVYVINNENYLAGLSLATNGSATSLFGELGDGNSFTGNLRQYFHQESLPQGAAGSFGAVAGELTERPVSFSISIGQGINGDGIALTGASAGQLTTANAASLAGTWQGTHGFCGGETCFELITTITFDGLTVSGSTQVDDGTPVPLQGGITEFGEVSLVSFVWSESTYTGAVFFVPDGTGRLAMFGESPDSQTLTIAALMSRQ